MSPKRLKRILFAQVWRLWRTKKSRKMREATRSSLKDRHPQRCKSQDRFQVLPQWHPPRPPRAQRRIRRRLSQSLDTPACGPARRRFRQSDRDTFPGRRKIHSVKLLLADRARREKSSGLHDVTLRAGRARRIVQVAPSSLTFRSRSAAALISSGV